MLRASLARALLIVLLFSLVACGGGVEGYEPEIAEYGDAVDAPEALELDAIDTSTITSTTTSTVGR